MRVNGLIPQSSSVMLLLAVYSFRGKGSNIGLRNQLMKHDEIMPEDVRIGHFRDATF